MPCFYLPACVGVCERESVFGASSTVGTVCWIVVSLQENTHSQIPALFPGIGASPAQKQQVHHSGAPVDKRRPPLGVQNIIPFTFFSY